MALYCYMIEEGDYDLLSPRIVAHKNKYTQDEFDNICMEIIKKHGTVKDKNYTVPATLEKVESTVYDIYAFNLISHLINEYGFIELNIPSTDGRIVKEHSRTPPDPNGTYVMIKTKTSTCPFEEQFKRG